MVADKHILSYLHFSQSCILDKLISTISVALKILNLLQQSLPKYNNDLQHNIDFAVGRSDQISD